MTDPTQIPVELMIDYILLFPYYLSLKARHFFYDHGWKKVRRSPVRTIGIGNLTVGGTGKTPHTEMIVRTLLQSEGGRNLSVAVLSRGHKRKLRGFQVLPKNASARLYGDEPSQIKNKFPRITVAVDKDRVRGCNVLNDPEAFLSSKAGRKCRERDFPGADVVVLDDSFQYRSLKTDLSIVLVDFSRPVFRDRLMPIGRLRDLRERLAAADVVIVTKCPFEMNGFDRGNWAEALGIPQYDVTECRGSNGQYLFFTTIAYDEALPVFQEGDQRYLYSSRAVVFSGIANDSRFCNQVRLGYRMVGHLNYPDHHKFTKSDVREIASAANANPTAVVLTTEKDCQRFREVRDVPDCLRRRLFYIPIRASFLDDNQRSVFNRLVLAASQRDSSGVRREESVS